MLVLLISMSACVPKEEQAVREALNNNMYISGEGNSIAFTKDSCYFIQGDVIVEKTPYSLKYFIDKDMVQIRIKGTYVESIDMNDPFKSIPESIHFHNVTYKLMDLE